MISTSGGEQAGKMSEKKANNTNELDVEYCCDSNTSADTVVVPGINESTHMLQEDDQDPIAHLAGHAHTLLPSEASKFSEDARSVNSFLDSHDTYASAADMSSYSEGRDHDFSKEHIPLPSSSLETCETDLVRSMPVEIPRPSCSSSYRSASHAGSTSTRTSSFYDYSSPTSSINTYPSIGKRRKLKPGGSEIPDEDLRNDFGSLNSSSTAPTSRFACPYFKRNAARHQAWRSCAGPGWDTVHRTK
jgi:hypothetical protein